MPGSHKIIAPRLEETAPNHTDIIYDHALRWFPPFALFFTKDRGEKGSHVSEYKYHCLDTSLVSTERAVYQFKSLRPKT